MAILIVDDSADERLLIHHILKDAGYRHMLSASSARDAFKHLNLDQAGRETKVDLILMDVRMTEIDGIEACRRIKSVEALQDIPIIVVTARSQKDYLSAAFEAGAIDFINKPLDRVELLARVKSALKLKQEIDARKNWEHQLTSTIGELDRALQEMSALHGLIPVCPLCRQLGAAGDRWHELEAYIHSHPDATFGSRPCPACTKAA